MIIIIKKENANSYKIKIAPLKKDNLINSNNNKSMENSISTALLLQT